MVIIVRPFPVAVEELCRIGCLPSVAELRPASCPVCAHPAYPVGGLLGIVGHGLYRRQVMGIGRRCRECIIWIRRYLCRGCRRTISILPDALHPGRWYAAAIILAALVLSLLRSRASHQIRKRLGTPGVSRGWKTLERWQHQLLTRLWSWFATQLGAKSAALSREDRRSRLVRLMGLCGTADRGLKIEEIARSLLAQTAHVSTVGWELRRGPPNGLTADSPSRARS